MKSNYNRTRILITVSLTASIVAVVSMIAPKPGAASGVWTPKSPISSARYFSRATTINGVLYTAGGWNGCTPYSNLEAYDPMTNVWTHRAPMNTARGYHDIAALNGLLYAVGGSVGCGAHIAGVEAYDPNTNSWANKAPLPQFRTAHSVIASNGKLYVIGGWNGSALASNTEYDPVTDTWTERAPMPTARYFPATAVVDNIVYVIGGSSGSAALNTVEAYDPVSNTWTTKSPMAATRPSLGAVSMNGRIYAVGGQPGCVGLETVEIYDPVADNWSTGPPLPSPRRDFGIAALNNSIYVVGGYEQYNCGSGERSVDFVLELATNQPPSISSPTVTVFQNSNQNVRIATVDDAEDGQSVPSVEVSSANPSNGVTISNITNNNGEIMADLSASAGIGQTSFTLTVTDSAGVQTSATLIVHVQYAFVGFLQPIENLPLSNSVRAGQSVPVKFSLNGDQGLNVLMTGYPASGTVECGNTVTAEIAETASAGGSGLSYDASTDQYTYVWKTSRNWQGSCRLLVIRLNDGSALKVARFDLR